MRPLNETIELSLLCSGVFASSSSKIRTKISRYLAYRAAILASSALGITFSSYTYLFSACDTIIETKKIRSTSAREKFKKSSLLEVQKRSNLVEARSLALPKLPFPEPVSLDLQSAKFEMVKTVMTNRMEI